MQRATASFITGDIAAFKQQMLAWGNQFNICCYLDSNNYPDKYHTRDCLLATEAFSIFSPGANILHQLKLFTEQHHDWLFGHVSYDLKNEIEVLTSSHKDQLLFPDIFLFQPVTVIELNNGEVTIGCLTKTPQEIFNEIKNFMLPAATHTHPAIVIKSRISKAEYITAIQKLQQHILRGDCYEINYCQEFFSENVEIDPLLTFQKLLSVSPMPFSAYYKLNDKYLLCASPERFIKKEGANIISQPMKGTHKRNVENAAEDDKLKTHLHESAKDRSENVMVADLVRNDISKICKEGSVQVQELYGVYSYPLVHQMISTITGQLKSEIDFADILQATFPMGSMTGAPKKNVMQLIETYERTKRGIYSGCIGYITPANNFDFAVVIRSIMYNTITKYISYQVGSGITFYSNAEDEYEECLLKAESIKKVL